MIATEVAIVNLQSSIVNYGWLLRNAAGEEAWDKAGRAGLFVNMPAGLDLAELTAEAKLVRSGRDTTDFVLLFVNGARELNKAFAPLCQNIADGGMIWVAWPKKSSGVVTDITENVVRETGLPLGWVDVKVCAIDEIWSGLKFYRRKAAAKTASKN